MILAILATGTLAAIENGSSTGLSEAHIQDLTYLMEEEKLARDLYAELGEYWNLRVFNNITGSEETHRSRVEELAIEYDLEYQVLPPGEFTDPELQQLYRELLAKGLKSVTDALEVGRSVEVLDIEDLDSMLERNPPEDVTLVYQRLRSGSEKHLAAFERQLDR